MKAIYFFSTIKPLIVSGPSGVGKGSLVTKLLQNNQDFVYSVSLTTRKPRPNEKNGINYFFVEKEVFDEQIKKEAFLEVCEVHGNLYGIDRLKQYLFRLFYKKLIDLPLSFSKLN